MTSKPSSWPPQPHRSAPDPQAAERKALRVWREKYDAMIGFLPPAAAGVTETVEPMTADDVEEFQRLRAEERAAWEKVLLTRRVY